MKYVYRERINGEVRTYEIGERDEPRLHPEEWCDRRLCAGFWGKEEKVVFAVKALNQSKHGRFKFCPECGENGVQPRTGGDYCDNCCWPDEILPNAQTDRCEIENGE